MLGRFQSLAADALDVLVNGFIAGVNSSRVIGSSLSLLVFGLSLLDFFLPRAIVQLFDGALLAADRRFALTDRKLQLLIIETGQNLPFCTRSPSST